MKHRLRKGLSVILAMVCSASLLLTGCGETPEPVTEESAPQETLSVSQEENAPELQESDAPEVQGLVYQSTMPLRYATGYGVYYYEGGYKVIEVKESQELYLLVPEGAEAPENLPENMQVLYQPLDRIYLAATASMALFDALDGLDNIKLVGTQQNGWYVENASKAMEEGSIVFAGKYSEPDYEMMIDTDCDLAIESTMILHSPKVKEMIQLLEIPVFTDYASYESNPLGRTEWIKLYGAMLNKEDVADAFFQEQMEIIDQLETFENTGKTVAYFYVHTDGTIVVRSTDDYIPKMIDIAGGKYIYDDISNTESNSASVSISMEEFYATAQDADYIVYNAAISNPIKSIDELVEMNALFADFKAVKEGNVWTTGKSMYQATDVTAKIIQDFHYMLTDGDQNDIQFLTKVY